MKLLEFYSNLKDKIEDDEIVKENFQTIFAKFKKTSTNKEVIEELEKKFFAGEKLNLVKSSKSSNKENNVADSKNNSATKIKKRGVKRNYSKMKNPDLESVESEGEQVQPIPRASTRTAVRSKKKRTIVLDDESEEDFNDESDY